MAIIITANILLILLITSFLEPVPTPARSIASLPDPKHQGEYARSLMTEEQKQYEDLGWGNYKEQTWPTTESPNTFNSVEADREIQLKKDRELARKHYGIAQLRQCAMNNAGRGGVF